MIDPFGNVLFEDVPYEKKRKPWNRDLLVDEYSAGDVECFQVSSRHFLFTPNDPDVPNQVAQCLDFAYRRGRVMMISNEIEAFEISLTIEKNTEWPYAELYTTRHVEENKDNEESQEEAEEDSEEVL